MPERLKEKIALVVGAGSIGPGWGNGKATAVAFAREGAKVFCADINLDAAKETAAIINKEGGEARAHKADVTKAAEVAAMVAACGSAYGRIDILDNNVGIAEVGGVVEVSEQDWDRVMAVNLKSAFLAMKHVIPLMLESGGGSIINISSIAAIRYTGVPYSTYYASKAALSHLTRTTAVEYAPKKIRVNAILPGLMRTPMVGKAAGLAQSYANVARARETGADGLRRRRLGRGVGGGVSRQRRGALRHRHRTCRRRRRYPEICLTFQKPPSIRSRRPRRARSAASPRSMNFVRSAPNAAPTSTCIAGLPASTRSRSRRMTMRMARSRATTGLDPRIDPFTARVVLDRRGRAFYKPRANRAPRPGPAPR